MAEYNKWRNWTQRNRRVKIQGEIKCVNLIPFYFNRYPKLNVELDGQRSS